MIQSDRSTRQRIESQIRTRRSSARPLLQDVADSGIHCLTEHHFGDIDAYRDYLRSATSEADPVRVVNLVTQEIAKSSRRAFCWLVLQSLSLNQKAGTINTWSVLSIVGLGSVAETIDNYDLAKYLTGMKRDGNIAIVPVFMKSLDDTSRTHVHELAESLAGEPIRILCLWNRSLSPKSSHAESMRKVYFDTDEFDAISNEELTKFLLEIDQDFKDADHFDNSYGLIWNRLIALERVLQLEQTRPGKVADSLSESLFEFLLNEYDQVSGQLSNMPDMNELKEIFSDTELPHTIYRSEITPTRQRTLRLAAKLNLISLHGSSNKSAEVYDLSSALHADFRCNSTADNTVAKVLVVKSTETSKTHLAAQQGSNTSSAIEIALPKFRPGATAASRLKTLLLLNQGRRIPMWLVSHPTMGGTSAFRVIRDRYRDPGHVTFVDDPVSRLQMVEVGRTLNATAASIGGNMLDVSLDLISPTRESFAIANPLVENGFAHSIEKEVLNGASSIAIMKKVFLTFPNTPIWEYWLIWLLSVRLKPETIDRDLRELVKQGHPNNLPGLLKIPHEKSRHECDEHAEFDVLWTRSKQSKRFSEFVEEWAKKIPRVESNRHTFIDGLDWYIYSPK